MVWLHGGGFSFGSGNAFLYGPDFLVAEDVVLVTLNYRLGPLGFLSVGGDASGNAGLKVSALFVAVEVHAAFRKHFFALNTFINTLNNALVALFNTLYDFHVYFFQWFFKYLKWTCSLTYRLILYKYELIYQGPKSVGRFVIKNILFIYY